MSPKKIVITGGPGTGKTAVIDMLEKEGYFCFEEIIRSLTLEAKKDKDIDTLVTNPLLFVSDPLAFNTKILTGRINQFNKALEQNNASIFFDRAIPDVIAYMDYFKQEYDTKFTYACKFHTYDEVFILPPWEEIYVSDNERLESFEQAVQIHEHLEEAYLRFGYKPVIVPKDTITNRVSFILKKLNIE
ncbi:MAG: ATP-binding protein [Cellulophaga sp.]